MLLLIYPGDAFFWLSVVASVLGVLLSLITTPWKAFFSVSARSLLWLGYWLVLTFVWSLRVPVSGVIAMHLTALTAAVFIFGWSLTLLLGVLALVANQLLQPAPWFAFPGSVLLGVLMPVLAARIAFEVVNRIPVNNLFVFILGGGFFGSVFTVAFSALAAWFWFWLTGAWSLRVVLADNLIIYALSAFPEGFIGGSVLTTVTVLWPDLVKNYDDNRYLSD